MPDDIRPSDDLPHPPEPENQDARYADDGITEIEYVHRLDSDTESDETDHDVPFHLPKAEDFDQDAAKPKFAELYDPETDEPGVPDDPLPAVKKAAAPKPPAPTMPIPREPGVPDYKQTLPGSGGMDPNPDFSAGNTQANIPPVSQNTVMNMQTVKAEPPQATIPQAPLPPPPAKAAPAAQGAARPTKAKAKRRGCLGCSPGCLMVFAGVFITFCGGLTILTLIVSTMLASRIDSQLKERVASFDDYANFESTFYYDRHGVELYEVFNEGRRTNVHLDQIPQALIDATLAIEDDNFYSNPGIDIGGTTRALLQYVGLAEGSTGGSTITQQLVRNVLFEPAYRAERSVQRKVEEILLALSLTQQKSKDEILEMYLNEIYYGNLSYGAAAAARIFFDKDVADLTLGEAALLAGLPQAPANLDPLNPAPEVQAAVDLRWRTVLDRMVTENFITNEQRNEALRQGLTFNEPDAPFRAPHFTVFAQQELEQLMIALGYQPEEITRGGLQVYTTVDLQINDMAQGAIRDQINRLITSNNVTNGSVLVTKPITGEILAMVGSVDYNNDAIDGRVNVAIAQRQPGSTVKPFTYAGAMELGMTPADLIWDTPMNISGPGVPAGWPVNYDRRYHGPMRMRSALANSYNIPAVATLRRISVNNLLAIMQRFGVRSLGNDGSRFGLSLTLGGGEMTLLELTRAYSVFSNQGTLVPTTSILCVINNEDQILYQYENGCPRGRETPSTINRLGLGQQVLDPRIAFVISDILADNVARSPAMGSNSPLNTGNIGASVKTGTTDDVKDNWTVGYTRNVAVGVWVGNSNGDPMVNSSGLTGAAPIWNAVMTNIYNNQAMLNSFAVNNQLLNDQLQAPQGMTAYRLCNVSTLTDPALDCGSQMTEWLLDGPAGIPNADGALEYPAYQPTPQPQVPASGPYLVEAEPGIYRVLAHRIPAEYANQISFTVGPGQKSPPPPIYCQVPVELAPTAQSVGAQEQLFLAPPADPEEAVEAENFARQANIAFLPTIACTPELLTNVSTYGPTVVTTVITSPSPGQVLTDETPVMGTVQFSAEQALYYKVEVIGENITSWTTIGTTHHNSVVNGQLENLYVPGLVPGNYRMRLVLIDHTGGPLQAPYEVPFSVSR